MDSLSVRLKSLREAAGLNQTELGKKIGVGKSTISMYENGKSTPGDEIKLKISEYFNVSLDYLFGKTDLKNSELTNFKYAQNAVEDELLSGFRTLSKDEQEELLEILRMKLRKLKKNVKSLSLSTTTPGKKII